MNRVSATTIVFFSGWLFCGCIYAELPEVENARQHGAQGRVTLRVTDSTGFPVDNAEVSVAFWGSDSLPDVVAHKGNTDTNGLFVAAGITIHNMNYEIKKADHYTTQGQYWFHRRGENCVQNGRWQPWNLTNTVVLKEHRNPIPMYAKRVDISIPVLDEAIGFDLEKGDWVAPHGQGSHADLIFTYNGAYDGPQVFSKRLCLAFNNNKDGLRPFPLDKASELMSMYSAPDDDYATSLVLERERTRTQIIKSKEFEADRYLIIRVRTVTDKEGNIISANYGKIYGPINYGRMGDAHRLIFDYYLNPTPNDRNIEFNPEKNLHANPGKLQIYMP